MIAMAPTDLRATTRLHQWRGRALSGLVTGASWLCYYYAIQMGQVNVVVQVDKLSLLVSIAFAAIAFGERLSKRAGVGFALIVVGTARQPAFSDRYATTFRRATSRC